MGLRWSSCVSGRLTDRRTGALAFVVCAVSIPLATASSARADDPPPDSGEESKVATVQAAPPPLDTPYLQYGFAFTSEFVASAGRMCSGGPCILGSGGGVVVRVGRRSAGPWYFGGAYELSKQDPASLYRFATLQQVRAEARWYLSTGYDTQPYATMGLGLAGYGNEWGIDTWGPIAHAGIGIEAQLSRRTVIGMALSYRVTALRGFVDSTGSARPDSFAQLIGIDLTVEARDPLAKEAR